MAIRIRPGAAVKMFWLTESRIGRSIPDFEHP
jgi:hypothetical protein